MKGKITITADEHSFRIEGGMGFDGHEEIYEMIYSIIECSGLASPDGLANLFAYCAFRPKTPGKNKSEIYEFRIPR